ncbi:MAG: UDP-N-acetylmuramoyl-tripeptide--D-alanyl-D-alanine ligase, partial [Proteobacteria bacterium]|nr:UDP-N-acetylmuramoyl-tripeptide--D-alanyl-D-alanine ligase [Pseudomonadota bacterium]
DDFDTLDLQTIERTPFKKGYLVQADRRKAIRAAIEISKPEDIVLVAGKGHETYQITNAGTIHFDDREELSNAAEQFSRRFDPIPWTADDLCTALDETPAISNLAADFRFSGISTDSRTIDSSQVFIALKGAHFDGHAFVCELADRGIKGCIVQKGFLADSDQKTASLLKQKELILFEINDTLIGLGKLAHFQRLRSNVKVLAITGSSGKTTTRKITREIFCTRFHTHATIGNLNNEIGLPLTLLKLSLAHEWAIVEMGMNHAGEIARLSRIAAPDIAMVINTGEVHLEGLGSIENVARAKAEIFEGVHENAVAIIFSDDKQRPILEAAAQKNNNIKTLMFFGSDPEAEVCLSSIMSGPETTDFKVQFNACMADFCVPSPARFIVDNCLAAISAAIAAGIDTECMQKGIKAFTPVAGRLNIYRLASGIHLIDDTYNANPVSVTQALNTLDSLGKNCNRIAVLGDMLELGKKSEELHKKIGHTVAQLGISRLFVFGPLGEHTIKGAIENGFPAQNIFSGTKSRIARKLADTVSKDTWILFKGSRGMAMESVIQEFTKNINTQF